MLRVMRKLGGWMGLGFPTAAVVVGSELASMVDGTWGVAPTDGRSATAPTRLRG